MHQLILFIHERSGPEGDRLRKSLRLHLSDVSQELCAGLRSLRERLKYPESIEKPVIYVLFADTKNRLDQLQGLHEHLEDRRLVLILPDNQQSTRSGGLRLLPRFITYPSDTYYDLIAVIEKMAGVSFKKRASCKTTGG